MPSSETISQIQLPDGNIYDLGSNLILGETSETAYRGDRGKIAYDHSQTTHAPANAEANQNAFSNITVGSTTIAADSKTDTFTLTAGSNVTLTPDATNDEITIAATDTTYSSKSAASGGTDVSLVTTGEKYTWNNKSSFSGNYNDLTDKPTIPTVNNATLTIQKNGSSVGTFTANASSNVTANIIVPATLADLSADATHRLVTDTEKALWNSKTKVTINRWEVGD